MSDENPSEPAPEPSPDPASRLEHIVDESEERGECASWIHEQFVAGRDADAILEEVIGLGWSADDAEAMVEEGRRQTRHLRGIVTREEVSAAAAARYRRGKRRLAVIVSIAFAAAMVAIFICIMHAQKK